jgi:DNA-binding response OmpR family regulator
MRTRALVIAEDNSVRRSLARLLEEENYKVFSARDDEEAVDLFSGASIDLVVLDLHAEAACSSNAARAIKELAPMVPVIALVAKTDAAGGFQECQVDAQLLKPLEITQLIQKAKELLTASGRRMTNI